MAKRRRQMRWTRARALETACGEVAAEVRGRRGVDAPGSKNSTPDLKFIVIAPVVTRIAAETRSSAAAPLRGPRAEALNGILT